MKSEMRNKCRAYASHAIRKVTQHTIVHWSFHIRKNKNFERIDAMLATSNHVKRKKDEKNSLNLAL
jgi:hypothetical protein